jgi:hypothetical protein
MALSVVFAEGIVINEPDYDLSSRFVELALMLWWLSIKDTDKSKNIYIINKTKKQASFHFVLATFNHTSLPHIQLFMFFLFIMFVYI